MKYLIIATMLVVTSCGYDINCNYSFWAAGMTFCYEAPFDSEPNTQMIEEIVNNIEVVSRIYYPHVQGLTKILSDNGTTVYVTIGDIKKCVGAPVASYSICYEDYGGYNQSWYKLIVIEEPWITNTCLLVGSLMHEILHTVDWEYLNGHDHSTPFLFAQNYLLEEDKKTTIEWKLSQILRSKTKNYPLNCK